MAEMASKQVVYVFASDCSGSTSNDQAYHEYGSSLLKEFNEISASNEKVYLIWNSCCKETSEEKLNQMYKDLDGDDGTDPGTICRWLLESKYKNHDIYLFLLTDGEIWNDSISGIVQYCRNLSIRKTNFYAFNTNENQINLSVCSGFMKEAVDIYKNKVLVTKWRRGKVFDFEPLSESFEKFEELAESLCEYIKYDFINAKPDDSQAVETIKKIKNLKTKLMRLLDDEKKKNDVESELKNIPANVDRAELLKKLSSLKKDFIVNCTDSKKKKVELVLGQCLNYLESSRRSYSFNELKFSEIRVPEEALPIEIDESDKDLVQDFERLDIEDIIYLDTYRDVPVVTLEMCDLFEKFNATGSWVKFKKIISCPVGHEKLAECLASKNYHVYTLDTFMKLVEKSDSNTLNDPMTRQSIAGGIILSQAYDSYNDSVISSTYFDSKKLKNLNFALFYWLLYKTLKSKSYIDQDVLEKFKSYALHRISKDTCNIGLIKISEQDLDFETKVWIALFYVVEASSHMFGNHDKYYLFEKLRMYNSNVTVSEVLEILQHFVKVDEEFVRKRAKIMNTCSRINSLPSLKDKRFFLIQKLFKKSDKYGFLLPQLKNENEDFKCLNYLNIDFKKNKLDEKVLDAEVSLDCINSLIHFTYEFECGSINEENFELCEATLRPRFVIDDNLPWYDSFLKTIKLPFLSEEKKILYQSVDYVDFNYLVSTCKLCGEYLQSTDSPSESAADFAAFFYKRKHFNINNKKFNIFYTDIDKDLDITYEKYIKMYQKLNLNRTKFLKIFNDSVKRVDRIVQENSIEKLNQNDGAGDNVIDLFLSECDKKYKKL